MYAKIVENAIIEYPSNPWADNPNVSIPENWNGGIIDSTEYVYVANTDSPQIKLGWRAVESNPILYEGAWKQSWTTSMVPVNELKQIITDKRYAIEVSGTTVSNNKFATDRESQTKYVAIALDIAQSDVGTYSINWKTSDGFVTLTGTEMLNVISAVRQHVQASFDKEAEYYQLIDTASKEVLEDTDFAAGWPANS